MSDPKRATLITVGAPKSAKNNVNKTVRLTINLDESNESKYPELNYKELVIAEEKKKKVVNGKTSGLDPFSDNDDDVERVARKFEQKYGGKSTYGRKGRSKHDDFADIGAGYDENDSFIDNTHGYDEMIPPECDTFYGGFYINCGSLEFKTIPDSQAAHSDGEPNRRNKRRISSSSSEESSESSSESESQDEKDTKAVTNGQVDSHKTEHRKKKKQNSDKQNARKVRRTDSSAATSGKQTSDDNGHGEAESDSRSSQSDSLTSKPAPSSENAATSDSSREVEAKLPSGVEQAVEALEAAVEGQRSLPSKELLTKLDPHIVRVETAVRAWGGARVATARVAAAIGNTQLSNTHTQLSSTTAESTPASTTTTTSAVATATTSISTSTTSNTTSTTSNTTSHNKRKAEDELDQLDIAKLTPEEKEAKIVETLEKLKALIEERKPAMIANYNAECERVQEERKKIQLLSAEGGPVVEKRLPKRRFPWCGRARALLGALRALGGGRERAAALLARRALPLFPSGFVRMPTLLRQADLNKELKAATEAKRQRLGSSSQPPTAPPVQFTEPIQFPSSLTVTTTTKTSPDKTETPMTPDEPKVKTSTVKSSAVTSTVKSSAVTSTVKSSAVFESIMNSIPRTFPLSKDLIVEKPEKKDRDDRVKEELYLHPNNIGSITITPVLSSQKEKKTSTNINDKLAGFLKVKSPAALNEMVKTKDRKKHEKNDVVKEQKLDAPLHIDTSYQTSKKESSPKMVSMAGLVKKQLDSLRASENNIPRPGLIPVHHSPTFAKPDKRPPEVKKKKELLIVSDVDPLGDIQQEPVAVDDSSSDVELVEDSKVPDNCEPKQSDNKCEVPSKDKTVHADTKKVNSVKISKDRAKEKAPERDDATDEDIDTLMKNIRDMQQSQEPTEYNSNSYGGVITNAKHEMSSTQQQYERPAMLGAPRSVKDKFTERTSLNKMDGCSVITG